MPPRTASGWFGSPCEGIAAPLQAGREGGRSQRQPGEDTPSASSQLIPGTASTPSLRKLRRRCLLLTTAPPTFSDSGYQPRAISRGGSGCETSVIRLSPRSPRCSLQTVPVKRQGAPPRSAPLAAEPIPALLSLLPPTCAKATFGGAALSPLALKSPLA